MRFLNLVAQMAIDTAHFFLYHWNIIMAMTKFNWSIDSQIQIARMAVLEIFKVLHLEIWANIGSGDGMLPDATSHYLKWYWLNISEILRQEMLKISILDTSLKDFNLLIYDWSHISQGPMS